MVAIGSRSQAPSRRIEEVASQKGRSPFGSLAGVCVGPTKCGIGLLWPATFIQPFVYWTVEDYSLLPKADFFLSGVSFPEAMGQNPKPLK